MTQRAKLLDIASTHEPSPRTVLPTRGSALLIAGHPGRELRVHGWQEVAYPRVMILTDGSGASGESRLASSDVLIARAAPGSIYGRFSDAALYEAVLDGDVAVFTALADEIAEALADDAIEMVVGDAAEGYNPTHDVCRLLINTAVGIAQRRRPKAIASYAFPLVAPPDAWGPDAFRREILLPVEQGAAADPAEIPPFYEKYGEQRVASGAYTRVIRYGQHVRPLADALARHAAAESRMSGLVGPMIPEVEHGP